jgi:hypothetical protein
MNMTISDAWFVVYQPKYNTPSVFDLHERGRFKARPAVTKNYGFRLIVNPEFQVKIQYLHLIEREGVDENTGDRYSYVNQEIFINLMENLALDKEELAGRVPDDDIRNEIIKAHEEWYTANVPLGPDGTIDRPQLEKKLTACINEGKGIIRKKLVRKNNSWVQAALPHLIQDFNHGLYQRMSHNLYPDYTARGGEDTEQGLIKKIFTFYRIYEYEESDELLKPDGSRWENEDEIWNSWAGFAGSESEAERVCSTIESVFRPVNKIYDHFPLLPDAVFRPKSDSDWSSDNRYES